MKTVKSKILPIAIAVAVLICSFAVPVSAATSSGYYDTGKVFVKDWTNDDFATFVMVEGNSDYIPVDYYDGAYYWEDGKPISKYVTYLYIDCEPVTLQQGDVYNVDLFIDWWSYSAGVTSYYPTLMRTMGEDDSGVSIDVKYNSAESLPSRQWVEISLDITAKGEFTFDGIMLTMDIYHSRSEKNQMRIYDTSYYRIYGGDPNSAAYPKYENPADGPLGDAAGDLNDKENELDESLGSFNDSAADFAHSADEPFKAFSLSTFRDGMMCWATLLSSVLNKSLWLYRFIRISLALGLFAFLVGMATVVVQVHTSKVRRENAAAARRSRSKRGG